MGTMAVQSAETIALPYVDVPVIYAASDRARVFYDVADPRVQSFVREPHRVRISDARGIRDRLSLDDQGSIIADHRNSLADEPVFIAMNKVQQLGWPEKNRRYVDELRLETKVGKPGHPADDIESRLCRYAKGHCWYYFSDLGPHEILVFKGHDSEDPSSTKAAHVASDDPSSAAPGLRTSVEARFFCLFT